MMILLILVGVVSVLFAVIAAREAKELPDSVSSFSYIVGTKPFTAWAVLTAICLLYPTINAVGERFSWIAFLQSAGLLMVAASPLYKSENKVLHYVGGYLFGIMTQVVVAMINPWWLFAWVLFPTVYLKKDWHENATFASEAICFGTLIAVLIDSTL